VEDEEQRRRGRRGARPVQIDEVTIAGDDPLAPPADALAAEERTPDGL
jgi:hypothetical protein